MASLEFTLEPADLPRLARWSGMRAGRAYPADMVWHDTPDGALAADGRCLAVTGPMWRLTRLRPDTAVSVLPTEAEARRPAAMGLTVDNEAAPLARFSGRRRTMRWTAGEDSVGLQVLDGQFDGPSANRSACRVTLDGPAAALPSLAIALAHDMALQVPRWGFAEQALAAAQGETPPPRALGAPEVADGQPITASLAAITGHLLDVMIHWAAQVQTTRTPEPVHQMRVATRRLRSALTIYRSVAACPELVAVMVPLKLCAARLGVARDWDVFLGGLGAQLAEAFPGDPRCTAMLRAASRRQRNAYAELQAFLAGPDFRTLTVALACAATLHPWDGSAPADGLRQDTARFAATVLGKRMKRVRQAGRGIETLTVPALHELRKDCKRLRYAAEFFATLFATRKSKRFLARLAALQEELGLLNDSAAVSGLMAQLGRLERSYAAGLVEGFSAAHTGTARDRIERTWKHFKRTPIFW